MSLRQPLVFFSRSHQFTTASCKRITFLPVIFSSPTTHPSIPRTSLPRPFPYTTPFSQSHHHTMSSNSAAWLTEAKSKTFEVKSAPSYTPEAGEILVENKAVAINPVDGSLQAFAWWPMEYPTVLGQDVAGEVVEVGSGVTKFKKGDRVVGHALGMATKRIQDNAFQSHTILVEHMVSPIPADMPYELAAVIPLGCSTAACGLFQDAPCLALQYPTEPAHNSTGKAILVWGGSSSVGSNAIQLAVAAGYEVITTASPKNFEYVKKLGASQAFDYKSPTIEEDLIKAFSGKDVAGVLDAIGDAGTIVGANVLKKVAGSGRVATTKGAADFTAPEGVEIKRIFGTTLKDNAVGKAIYQDFLPKALASGSFVPSPAPEVVGEGLGSVQTAVNQIMKGVSAKKLVVKL